MNFVRSDARAVTEPETARASAGTGPDEEAASARGAVDLQLAVRGLRKRFGTEFELSALDLIVRTESCYRFDRGEKLTLLFGPEQLQVYDATDE